MMDIKEEIRKRQQQRLQVGQLIIKVACSTFIPRIKLRDVLMTSTIISGVKK